MKSNLACGLEWKKVRAIAQSEANRLGKGVYIYRIWTNAGPGEWVYSTGEHDRPAGVFIETVNPNREPAKFSHIVNRRCRRCGSNEDCGCQ